MAGARNPSFGWVTARCRAGTVGQPNNTGLAMRILSIAATAMLAALAGCGGGGPDAGVSDFPPDPPSTNSGGSSGGSTAETTSPGAAQGFYTGSTSNGYAFNSVILETGEFWAIYGRSGAVYGAVHGSSRSSASTFTGSGFDFYLPTGTRTSSTFNGQYSSKRQISGTVSSTGASFTGSYDARYDTPATAAALVGTWTGSVVSQAGVQSASVTIDSAGRFQGSVTTCAYSGTARPRV